MTARGYEASFAESIFEQIKGFSEYGFPESHAASFALLVYASCWIKRHHPSEFLAALLNSQPLGFYRPANWSRTRNAMASRSCPPTCWPATGTALEGSPSSTGLPCASACAWCQACSAASPPDA
jgi:DNA polymerase III alpha subunit